MAQRRVLHPFRPEYSNHVWFCDFVLYHTYEGQAFRMLTVEDEYTRECLAIELGCKLGAQDPLEVLAELFVQCGAPEHRRPDNGSEFTARAVRDWLGRLGVKTLFIEPGSPWENGYWENFNGRLRDKLLARETFCTLREAEVLIENWRRECDAIRPHVSLGNRPPAPETLVDWLPPEAFQPTPEEPRLH